MTASTRSIRCTHCNNKVVQDRGAEVLVRTRGVIALRDGKCFAQCHYCGSNLELPLELVVAEVSTPGVTVLRPRRVVA